VADHPFADLRTRGARLTRAAKYSQNVVLRGRELIIAHEFSHDLSQDLGRPRNVENRLLLDQIERLGLLDFSNQLTGHVSILIVITNIVKRKNIGHLDINKCRHHDVFSANYPHAR